MKRAQRKKTKRALPSNRVPKKKEECGRGGGGDLREVRANRVAWC